MYSQWVSKGAVERSRGMTIWIRNTHDWVTALRKLHRGTQIYPSVTINLLTGLQRCGESARFTKILRQSWTWILHSTSEFYTVNTLLAENPFPCHLVIHSFFPSTQFYWAPTVCRAKCLPSRSTYSSRRPKTPKKSIKMSSSDRDQKKNAVCVCWGGVWWDGWWGAMLFYPGWLGKVTFLQRCEGRMGSHGG